MVLHTDTSRWGRGEGARGRVVAGGVPLPPGSGAAPTHNKPTHMYTISIWSRWCVWRYGMEPRQWMKTRPLGVDGQLQPNEDDIANGRRMH